MDKNQENLLKRVLIPIKSRSSFGSKLIKFVFGFLALYILTFAISFWVRTDDKKIMDRLSEVMSLPDEVPAVAKINDINALKSNVFFKDSDNGDKIFIFEKAERVFLYSVRLKKIINTGSIKEAGLEIN